MKLFLKFYYDKESGETTSSKYGQIDQLSLKKPLPILFFSLGV